MHRIGPELRNMLTRVAWLYVICCFFLVDTSYAQTGQKDIPIVSESGDTQPGSPIWTSASAIPDQFDWIQLTSGEWLKGDLKSLYQNELEFDSDKLDLLEFDWEDVKQVRGHKPNSVRFEKPLRTVIGIIQVVDDKVFVVTEEEVLEFDRSRLVTIAPGGELKEISYWSAKISLSLDVRQGNSDQIDYSAFARVQRRTSKSRFYADYQGIYNKTDGINISNNHKIKSYYDIFHTRKIFWRPLFGQYFRDPFSNIKDSITVGCGVGYHFINTPKTEFSFAPGLAYQYTENVSVKAGEDKYNSTPVFVGATIFETELTKRIDLNAQYSYYVVNQESGRYTHNAKVAFEVELTKRLDLDLSFEWDRIQEPKARDDGRIPSKNDFYFFFGIGFEL